MCRWIVVVLLAASFATAQEAPNPDELKKLYDEALTQLKAAQDRKNELAAENEKLAARIAELEGQLATRNAEAAGFDERTWRLRSQLAAWEVFLRQHPRLAARWNAFLSADVFDPLNQFPAGSD